jgi:small conductance mechanosensitive channel
MSRLARTLRAAQTKTEGSFMDMQSVQNFLSTTASELAIKVLAAIAFWIVGRWLIGKVISLVQAAMNRNHVAAMLAGAGVAIGAAWSGLLGNFAAGAFMLILRPFKVGDFVSVAGVVGTVRELGLFGTTMVTPDNVMTIVGNGKIFGDTIQNFSALPARRVERVAQLAGSVDPLEAIGRFREAVAKIPNISTEMAPEVALLDMNLNGPVIAVRPYCHTDHYWQVYFDTNEAIVRTCKEAGWPAPMPHAVHLVQATN